jgi:hypothetical protein
MRNTQEKASRIPDEWWLMAVIAVSAVGYFWVAAAATAIFLFVEWAKPDLDPDLRLLTSFVGGIAINSIIAILASGQNVLWSLEPIFYGGTTFLLVQTRKVRWGWLLLGYTVFGLLISTLVACFRPLKDVPSQIALEKALLYSIPAWLVWSWLRRQPKVTSPTLLPRQSGSSSPSETLNRCSYCGRENDKDSEHCRECGSELTALSGEAYDART